MEKAKKKNKFSRKVLFVGAVVLAVFWIVRVVTLTRKWDAYFPTIDVEWTDTIQQANLDIRMVEYIKSDLEEIETRFGEADEEDKEMYLEFNPQWSWQFYVVTYELANHTEEKQAYPMYDVLMAGDNWAIIPLRPYIFICNGTGEEQKSRRGPSPGETTQYTVVYAILEEWEPLYLEFGHDGALVRLNIPEGKEVIDGEVVEARYP